MPKVVPRTYAFARREPGLFVEIFFPKRVLYQTEIVGALIDGLDKRNVKRYLKRHARDLIAELAVYPWPLDPERDTNILFERCSVKNMPRRMTRLFIYSCSTSGSGFCFPARHQ